MDVAEFDQFADEYLATHADNIRLSGEDPDYFARYKIETLRRRWDAERLPEPAIVLDFGTGIGSSLPHLAQAFPKAELTGLDISDRSVAVAARRFPGVATLLTYDGGAPPLPAGAFDLIFSACVFHHIPAAEHGRIFGQLRALLKPEGALVIFEHNPLNPATRHIVATCPFDANAVLLTASQLMGAQRRAGFSRVTADYTAFFPGPLRALRPIERHLARLPFGAQYYTFARG
jgi:SAM-dependent methyltransferase